MRILGGYCFKSLHSQPLELFRFFGLSSSVRLSDFQILMSDEFGSAYAAVLLRDLVLTELGDLTGQGALNAGIDPKLIWIAICKAQNVPMDRWQGLNKKPRDRHAD